MIRKKDFEQLERYVAQVDRDRQSTHHCVIDIKRMIEQLADELGYKFVVVPGQRAYRKLIKK